MTRVKCRRCSGQGAVPYRTAQYDSRCFCCGGKGFYYRKPAERRLTEADHIAEINAKIAEEWPRTIETLKLSETSQC